MVPSFGYTMDSASPACRSPFTKESAASSDVSPAKNSPHATDGCTDVEASATPDGRVCCLTARSNSQFSPLPVKSMAFSMEYAEPDFSGFGIITLFVKKVSCRSVQDAGIFWEGTREAL